MDLPQPDRLLVVPNGGADRSKAAVPAGATSRAVFGVRGTVA